MFRFDVLDRGMKRHKNLKLPDFSGCSLNRAASCNNIIIHAVNDRESSDIKLYKIPIKFDVMTLSNLIQTVK